MAGIEFADVARLLSCREFAEAEGLRIQGGRLQCPFHNGHNFNMAFCNDGQRVYCHKCGRSGDVVSLAAAVWRMSQRDAAVELNHKFNLHLDGKTPTAAEINEWRHKVQQRDAKRQAAEAAVEAAEAEARDAWAAVDGAVDASPEEKAELQRQARNADIWLIFKRIELSIARGELE